LLLYKYYPWNIQKSKHIRDNLIHSILYFEHPSSFNDPFDTLLSFPTQINATIIENCIDTLCKHQSHNCYTTHPLLMNASMKHPEKIKQYLKKFARKLQEHTGVCCFTTEYKNLLMWAHYADHHRGICLEFDFPSQTSIVQVPPEKLQHNHFVYPRQVQYQCNRPIINFFNKNIDDRAKYFLAKSLDWAYEKEYRAITFEHVGTTTYHPTCLKRIILGCKMPRSDIAECLNLVKTMKYSPTMAQTILRKDVYGLDIVPIKVQAPSVKVFFSR